VNGSSKCGFSLILSPLKFCCVGDSWWLSSLFNIFVLFWVVSVGILNYIKLLSIVDIPIEADIY